MNLIIIAIALFIIVVYFEKRKKVSPSTETEVSSSTWWEFLKFKTGGASDSKKQSGPIWYTYIVVPAAVLLVCWLGGVLRGYGERKELEKVQIQNQPLPLVATHTSYSEASSEWPDSVQTVPLTIGAQSLTPRVWYTYVRDGKTNFYVTAVGAAADTLKMYKLGDTNPRLVQVFDQNGFAHNTQNKMDGSPGRYYITISKEVQVQVTGIINDK